MLKLSRFGTGCVLVVLIVVSALIGCFEGPQSCGENVTRVVSIDYSGPLTLPEGGSGDNATYIPYSVTATIERQDANKVATICYIVRDDDPWYKFFWAVDDVLADGFITFPIDRNTVTVEGNFSLYAHDGDICGAGWTHDNDGCSGEDEAEIYVQYVNHADGPTSPQSPTRTIRIQ
jgi:hypothetical protein